ncbi:hypothetical protein M885DRAFT_443688 [Pelagophyceae sp. CCMP2097]|nr:hypothetical protein M885DRAFT_443688 [Pelagophyceae sp. CCMP2097]
MAQCLAQAQAATVQAIQDGIRIMEVEFPPLPADRLDQPDTSAYDISKANTDLAVSFASGLEKQMGKRVAILYPDVAELERVAARAIEDKLSDEPAAGVTLHSMRKPYVLAELGTVFSAIFGGKGELMIQPVPDADVYVCLTFSAQELPDVEALCVKEKFDKPVILFNLKLDTQRGDLGLPAFPPKDLQWRFLSRVVPVYYLRTRQYSISMPKPPFVVNYQGAIFRQYPGRYQSLLDTGKNYRPVEIQSRRPALGEFKEILTNALRLGETGELATFARTGFKSITWWEEDKGKEELFDDWRR